MDDFLQVVNEEMQDTFNSLYNKFYSKYGNVSYLISTFPRILLYGRLLIRYEEVIGFVIYGFKQQHNITDAYSLFILAVGIEKEYRCRGYFTKLVDELKGYGMAIYLVVPEKNLGDILKGTDVAQSIILIE